MITRSNSAGNPTTACLRLKLARRALPAMHLRYDPNKKSFMLFSLPDLHLTDSVGIKHVGMTFPLACEQY